MIMIQTKITKWTREYKEKEKNFSAMLVNSQLVCLLPVGILNSYVYLNVNLSLFALVMKSPDGEWPIKYTYIHLIPKWPPF